MIINLNDEVKVKLTERGKEVLKIKHEELRKEISLASGRDIGEFKLRIDKEGYYHSQLWVLLNDFSEYFFAGAENVLEGCNLYFDAEEVEQC